MTMIDPDKRKFIFDKIGYKPHSAKQAEIHESCARFKVLTCGRRYGKTTFGGNELTVAAMDNEQIGYYWIVGPNYVQGEKEFRILYNNIVMKLKLGQHIKKQYNVLQGNMRIEMPWGTVIEVKSADRQDSLLGEGLLGVVMAEAARHHEATWIQYVRPTLTDYKGWAIFPSTPRGYNWFHDVYKLGQSNQPENSDYESWRLPSWENPIIYPGGRNDPEILQVEREASEQYFLQEYGADFVAFAGKIYGEFNYDIHVTDIRYDPLNRNFWTFDFGWANDFVCLDIMVDVWDNVFVWREYHDNQKASHDHGLILIGRDNPDGFHVDGKYGDPRGADSKANLELVIGGIYTEDFDYESGIELVKRWLKVQPDGKPKLYISENCPKLIAQMEQLRRPDPKPDKNAQEGQVKKNDHGPDALRYFFSQHFGLGAGESLSDLYVPGQKGNTHKTHFQHRMPLARNARF